MAYKVLILGASYGSLLGTKLLMAGHAVTLVCRQATADLINAEGTDVRIRLRGEEAHRHILSGTLPGQLDAQTPEEVDAADYDLVGLAMQEPQYGNGSIRDLLGRIAAARVPCLSIMNMPPLAYLKRIPGLDAEALRPAFTCPEVWDDFASDLVTLCSPDPQAFRPPEEKPNVLHVGLPTNFKVSAFADAGQTEMLKDLERDIAAVRIEGNEVPVKLRVFDSLFVPMAKWSMLLTGNYACVTASGVQPIRDAVHGDIARSREVYEFVDGVARRLGADRRDQVPFEKYAEAAQNLLKPSSVARAIDGGADQIERVDRLVQLVGRDLGLSNGVVDQTVAVIDARVKENMCVGA